MSLRRRRRAILFSLMTILLGGFFILLFWNMNAPRLDTTSSAVETRVSVLNNHLAMWDAYVRDAAMMSTRGALIGITQNLTGNMLPMQVADVAGNISSCLSTGQADLGSGAFNCSPNGANGSLPAKLDAFARLAQEALNINTTYALSNGVSVADWAPFELRVSFDLNYTIQDMAPPLFARWNRSKRYDVIVSVEGLPDPAFSRYGAQFMKPSFTRRNLTRYVVPRDLMTKVNISDMVAQREYTEDRELAPTYLERLAGLLTPPFDQTNSSGIETLLNPGETNVNPSNYTNTSFTDQQVFMQLSQLIQFACPNMTIRVAGPPPFDTLYLDVRHWARYNQNASQFNYTCGP
jgi:hypothetical protein